MYITVWRTGPGVAQQRRDKKREVWGVVQWCCGCFGNAVWDAEFAMKHVCFVAVLCKACCACAVEAVKTFFVMGAPLQVLGSLVRSCTVVIRLITIMAGRSLCMMEP
jgi:hypothetical protein